ncbi:TrbC/VirB2 family protein [Cytobacillus massiliigabonensis]|uniref:TrbC/VirB2 family protein n=1 Tax=Cytobacillus massiliigabonensis TaxID=1871011 RepID=UPI000C817EB6|nr:TrbC/VirB2 family protein [Cytobacillus massiliigabonensis]
MSIQTFSIKEFMAGEYKDEKKQKKVGKLVRRIGTSIAVPLVMAKPAFAATTEAVPATAKEWMGEQTLSALAHVLDPVVDILVALAFPVASVVIVGACFLFMFGSAERAWTMIQNAGLGYVLIQVSPLILNVLKQVGNAV